MERDRSPRSAGAITTYTHPDGSVGVVVEVTCNSSFIARSEEFRELTHDIALQIAAMNPKFIRRSEVLKADVRLGEVCLYEQPFIKDNSITVSQLIIGYEMKLKEEIQVRRFARFKLGDPEFTVATGEPNSLSG
jgi:elongation factor Ts